MPQGYDLKDKHFIFVEFKTFNYVCRSKYQSSRLAPFEVILDKVPFGRNYDGSVVPEILSL